MIDSAERKQIKKLIVFSTQDSSKISSWSNVPYLLCETLRSNDIELFQVTLTENMMLRYLVLACKKIFKLLTGRQTSWDYSRSGLHYYLVQRQMNMACSIHPHDAVLAIGCSYAPSKQFNKPLILFCDWPYEYYIENFLNREPDILERASLRRERRLIEVADFIFVMFPIAQQYVAKHFNTAKSHYLGNVINAIEKPSPHDITLKAQSKSLLFIGKPHYKMGADQLIAAFQKLKIKFPDLTLDIIGMDKSFFSDLPPGVSCHGYLDKGDDEQRKTYYQLLRKARIFVNTNPKWASLLRNFGDNVFSYPDHHVQVS